MQTNQSKPSLPALIRLLNSRRVASGPNFARVKYHTTQESFCNPVAIKSSKLTNSSLLNLPLSLIQKPQQRLLRFLLAPSVSLLTPGLPAVALHGMACLLHVRINVFLHDSHFHISMSGYT